MPTSSSGPMTMVARQLGQRPPPTPITGLDRYRRPTPPQCKSKEPPATRCSVESRCSVDNLVPIGSNYSTWEDLQLAGDPRRLQKLAYGLMHGEVDYSMLHDHPVYYRVEGARRRSFPCPAPGHRERAWQSAPTEGGRRQTWMSSETHGLTRTRSAPSQAAVTTPWVPQHVWQPRRSLTRQVTDRQMTAYSSMHQVPIELVASKANIYRRPQSASRAQSVRVRPQSSRSATRNCTDIRQRPASAVPLSRITPEQLFCPDCVTHYCGAQCDKPDQTPCNTGYEDCQSAPVCTGYGSKSYGDCQSVSVCTGYSSKSYEDCRTTPVGTDCGSKFDPDAFCDCAGYRSGYSSKPHGESGRPPYFPVKGSDPDELPLGPIDSYCDVDWSAGLFL